MAQYIDKDALVAEIKRRIKEIDEIGTYLSPKGTLTNLLCFLNTLEVEDVDLEKEILNHIGDEGSCKHGKWTWYECNKMIRYFFELGIKAMQKDADLENNDAVNATIDFPLIGADFPNIYPNYKELKDYCIRHCIKDNDKVKITIVKEK